MHLGEECRKEAKAKAKWCVCVCEAEGMSMSESRRGVARAQHTVSDVQSMMSPVRGGHSAGGARAPSPPPPTTPPSTPPATRAVRHERLERGQRAGAYGGDRWMGWGGGPWARGGTDDGYPPHHPATRTKAAGGDDAAGAAGLGEAAGVEPGAWVAFPAASAHRAVHRGFRRSWAAAGD